MNNDFFVGPRGVHGGVTSHCPDDGLGQNQQWRHLHTSKVRRVFQALDELHGASGIHVDEDGLGAEQGDDVDGGDPGLGGGDHLIPRAYAQRHQGDVHASGSRVERNGILAAVCVTELLLQLVTLRARGDPSRFQHLTDSAYFGVADGWLRKWQKVLHKRSNNEY